MTDAPKRIWLQDAGDYAAASLSSEVTWCDSPVDEDDSRYILATPESLAASPEVQALCEAARQSGYELARQEALRCDWHLRRYDLADRDDKLAGGG